MSSATRKKVPVREKSPDDIKEKTYHTKQIDTSITLLESREEAVVIESLLFLSKFADVRRNNLLSLQPKGVVRRLLVLSSSPNLCVLRLSLRLLSRVLDDDGAALAELDREQNDVRVLTVAGYLEHHDLQVRKFAVQVLSKITASNRITRLIFTTNIFDTILSTIKSCRDAELLAATLRLFYAFANSPEALATLPTLGDFDCNLLANHLQHPEKEVRQLVFKILTRLTSYNVDVIQQIFNAGKLVEKMLQLVVCPRDLELVDEALGIVVNCMGSRYSNGSFVNSLPFLSFCQWIGHCEARYLPQCSLVLRELSKNPDVKQELYDLSVEVPMLYLLKSDDRDVLNDACVAISNMSTHRYCCESMLTSTVLRALFDLLLDGDVINETALRTISDFSRRSPRTITMIYNTGTHLTVYRVFRELRDKLSPDGFLRLFEIVYKLSLAPFCQQEVVEEAFFADLLRLFVERTDDVAVLCAELFTYFVGNEAFFQVCSAKKSTRIILDKLRNTDNRKLIRTILMFLYTSSTDERTVTELIRNGLIQTLNNVPDYIKANTPIVDRIISMTYNMHLPLKFEQFNELKISEKLPEGFYIVPDRKYYAFPFLDILVKVKANPISIVYVVEYNYPPGSRTSSASSNIELPTPSTIELDIASTVDDITPDPYLFQYLCKMSTAMVNVPDIQDKIVMLAKHVDEALCGPDEDRPLCYAGLFHHLTVLKRRLSSTVIPVGFLRIGLHCERALLFKAMADMLSIPCSLVRSGKRKYWNEVALLEEDLLMFYVVDLMNDVGRLLLVGSREANLYCKPDK